MLYNRLLRVAFILSCVIAFFCPGNAAARQTLVLGSLGAGYDYWERTYDNEGDEELRVDRYEGDRREYFVWPEIELQSLGIHDTVSLRYAPVLKYDDLYDTTNLDHYLDLSGERSMTKEWRVELSNSFVMTDDPVRYGATFYREGLEGQGEDSEEQSVEAEQPADELTQNFGRRRYWTNNLILNTTYTYTEDSDAGIGYAYRVLRNDSVDDAPGAGYNEYDRHQLSGLWSYRFNSFWRTQVDLSYVEGLYEDREESIPPEDTDSPDAAQNLSQDLQQYWADLRIDYNQDANETFPLLYSFRGVQYDDIRQDIWVHQLTAGWNHAFDSRNRLVMGIGPSYVNSEHLDGEWGYNAYLNFTRTYQHWDIRALFNKSYGLRDFTGDADSGLADITDAGVDSTYQFIPDLSSTLFVLYRYESILNPQGDYYFSALGDREPLSGQSVGDVTYSRESFSAGASLDYTFLRWFVATVRYVFFQQNGDLIQESYADHRITLFLSASKELWR